MKKIKSMPKQVENWYHEQIRKFLTDNPLTPKEVKTLSNLYQRNGRKLKSRLRSIKKLQK